MSQTTVTKKRIPSLLRWIGWVLLVQFILINVSSAFYAYRLTHYTNAAASTPSRSNIFSKTWRLFTGPKLSRLKIFETPVYAFDTVWLTTSSGLKIEGWHAHTDSSKGSVLLLHGIGGNKSSVLDEANEFRYLGYDVMMIDFRNHGNSEGQSISFGVKETEEVKLAYDFLKAYTGKPVIIWGSSYGAVVASRTVSVYSLNPAGLILEMPFESLQDHLKARARILGFPQQPFAFLTTFWIGVENGFNGYKLKCSSYVGDVNCPVLLQWGINDRYVLRKETEKIFSNIKTAKKRLAIYQRSGHESLLRSEMDQWRNEVTAFLQSL